MILAAIAVDKSAASGYIFGTCPRRVPKVGLSLKPDKRA
jgi:hypothetical protein